MQIAHSRSGLIDNLAANYLTELKNYCLFSIDNFLLNVEAALNMFVGYIITSQLSSKVISKTGIRRRRAIGLKSEFSCSAPWQARIMKHVEGNNNKYRPIKNGRASMTNQ